MTDRKRVAVLGGGVGSLSAVYALTRDPNWQDRFDITVYQLGWRLGGKGATGREAEAGQRVLEHGLHLWFGFYENAFSMMREVYRELDRPSDAPLATWEQAFLPHNQYSMEQQFKNEWVSWNIWLPHNPQTPGDGQPFPSISDYVVEVIDILQRIFENGAGAVVGIAAGAQAIAIRAAISEARRLAAAARAIGIVPNQATGGAGHPPLVDALRLARRLAHSHFMPYVSHELEAYRAWIAFDAIGTALIGVLADDLLVRGPDAINSENFNAWMARHGCSPITLDSCLIQTAYDSSFALVGGNRPDMEAGTILRGAARMFLMFKGSVSWRFAAGTGDSVFAPAYLTLKKRGVKFKFFHEVTGLVTPPAGPMEVTEIQLNEQAHLCVPEYDPLVDVNGLPCWPSEPRYEQLVEGDELKTQGVDLESYWTTWKGGTPKVLTKGTDFDVVISGMSLEPLRLMGQGLAARHPPLGAMFDSLRTTRTQAFQLWMEPTLANLGWSAGSVLLSTFGEPLDTWADLSMVLASEHWPAGSVPQTLGYFCGAMTNGRDDIPPRTETDFPAQQDALAKQEALDFINQKLPWLWPAAFAGHDFRWDLLVDLANRTGPARFQSQFWRANVDPSERYVLSVTGSSQTRVRADQTGFANLFFAGDYTNTGINAGCMEAAVISGFQISRALTGWPASIPGESGSFV
jgi:uncharacterized protein with NAD-binding domain and iron-sulfur cluster